MRKAIIFSITVCLVSWAAFAATYWGIGLSRQSVGLNLFSPTIFSKFWGRIGKKEDLPPRS